MKQKDRMLMYPSKTVRGIKAFLLALLITLVVGAFSVVYGSDGTMETLVYDVHVQVEENNTLQVTETITINYLAPHHGIYRNINVKGIAESEFEGQVYKQDYNNKIKNIKVQGYDSQEYYEGDYFVIQIGSGDYMVEGVHTYEISYSCLLRDDRIPEFDSFYWNLIPYGWQMPIGEVNITVDLPNSVDPNNVEVISGFYGTTQTVDFQITNDNKTFSYSGLQFEEGQGVTFHSVMDEGYFKGEATLDWALWVLVIASILVALLALVLWLRFGRDPHMVKTVEFYPPEGTSPAEVGYIIDGIVDDKDLISLVIYLADQGHLSIEQGEDKKEFTLHKKNPLPDSAKLYLKTFYEGLFVNIDGEEIESVQLSELKETFYSHFTASKGQLRGHFRLNKENNIFKTSSMVARGLSALLVIIAPLLTMFFGAIYYGDGSFSLISVPVIAILIFGYIIIAHDHDKRDARKKSKRILINIVGGVFIFVGTIILAGISLFFELPVWAILISLVSFFVTMVFSVLMKRRTKKGVELLGKILGFKQFIKSAELDRINKLVEEDPKYFYHVLPYAYVFDLTNKWAKSFEDIAMEQPEWLESNSMSGNLFGALLISDMMRSTTRALESNLIPPESLSDGSNGGSGGSSGGGFSGGGGFGGGGMGGGGGGGW